MKITLNNFKCYSKATFTFPDTGLILLQGDSGSGKSTILKGILYALYGAKAVRKPYAFGSKSCSVELEILNLKIKRSSTPNILLVNQLEGDAAQDLINTCICSFDEFMVSSYIQQKNNTSILSLSPEELLTTVKKLAFDSVLSQQYKEKLKAMILTATQKLTESTNVINYIEKQLAEKQALKPVASPLPSSGKAAIKQYRDSLNEYYKKMDDLTNKLSLAQKNKLQWEKLNSDLENKNAQLALQTNNLQDLLAKQETVPANNYASQIKLLCAEQEWHTIKTALENASNLYNEQYAARMDKINTIKQDVWPTKSKTEATIELEQLKLLNNQAADYFKMLKTAADLKIDPTQRLKIQEEYTKCSTEYIKKLETVKLLKCPKCMCNLKIENGALIYQNTESVNNNDLIELKRKLDGLDQVYKLFEKLPVVTLPPDYNDNIPVVLTELKNYIKKCSAAEQELEKLQAPNTFEAKYQSQINEYSTKLQKLTASTRTYTDITNELGVLREKQAMYLDLAKKQEKLARDIELCKTGITALNTSIADVNTKLAKLDPVRINSDINTINADTDQLKTANAQNLAIARLVDEYEKWLFEKRTITKLQEELATKKLENKSLAEYSASLNEFKLLYSQAEIIATSSTIDSINQHTMYYLNEFFKDNPINVEIRTEIVGKANAVKLSSIINYKGNEYDNINQLSGGEFDRCTLASFCGINKMLNSSILILDESLASLDTETNTDIFTFLQELSGEKLIIVCSHEAVTGIFDGIITVGKN